MFPHKAYGDLTEAQRLWFLSLAMTDIGLAQKWAALAVTAPVCDGAADFYNPIHDAAIVCYCRPFSGCNLPDEERRTWLPREIAFPDGEPILHRQVKDLRNEFVAHTDMRRKDVVATRSPNAANGDTRWRVTTSGATLSPQQSRDLVEMCGAVIDRLYRVVAPAMFEHVRHLPEGGQFEVRSWLVAQR